MWSGWFLNPSPREGWSHHSAGESPGSWQKQFSRAGAAASPALSTHWLRLSAQFMRFPPTPRVQWLFPPCVGSLFLQGRTLASGFSSPGSVRPEVFSHRQQTHLAGTVEAGAQGRQDAQHPGAVVALDCIEGCDLRQGLAEGLCRLTSLSKSAAP